MATTITAGNATNGAAISSDGTGTLDIKTGTGAGTTAISINASQAVTMPGNLVVTGTITAGAGTPYVLNAYTSPATWTKPVGLKALKVTVVGAGGNGGNGAAPATAGAGGGGGGAAIDYILAPSLPGPVAVTAGPGTNSFGAVCSATAGSNAGVFVGAQGGGGSGGNVNINGAYGASAAAGGGTGGSGGPSILGGGGRGAYSNNPSIVGQNYGGGGGGGSNHPAAVSGSAGAPGIVIVEEFY
jgi:hypothetical protein